MSPLRCGVDGCAMRGGRPSEGLMRTIASGLPFAVHVRENDLSSIASKRRCAKTAKWPRPMFRDKKRTCGEDSVEQQKGVLELQLSFRLGSAANRGVGKVSHGESATADGCCLREGAERVARSV